MKKELLREWIIAIGIFSFSLFTIFYLIPSQIEATEEYELKCLSPAFFPEMSAVLITGLTVLFMISLLTYRRKRGGDSPHMTMEDEFRVLAAIGIAVVYVVAFKYMGFIPASILVLFALFRLQGKTRHVRLILLSAVTVLFVYFIFYYVLKVRFPVGLLWR